MNNKIAKIRSEYTLNGLSELELEINPISQFEKWFDEVLKSEITESNAMVLSTVENDQPSSRVVLLKGFDEEGFVFFTNYQSSKGIQIKDNAAVSLNFFWKELERQVRIQGKAVKVSQAESDNYFKTRPRGSQLGAWVSTQSSIIQSRDILEEKKAELEQTYTNQPITRPSHWGGYRVIPNLIEFWQGRPSRLHDRLVYKKDEHGNWIVNRLAP